MELQSEHLVVLMLENRSFDHLFGFLGKGDGLKGIEVNHKIPGDNSSTAFKTRKGGDFTAVGDGPSHSFKQTNEQLFGRTAVPADQGAEGATYSGFVASLEASLKYDLKREPTDSELQQAMNAFDPVQLPVLSALARSFVLCDRWFSDVPGPTMPKRAFVHAAAFQGYTDNAGWKPAFICKTIYNRLNEKGVSWRVYYHEQNDVTQHYPHVKQSLGNNSHFEGGFLNDVARDNLPAYSFIDPAFMSSAQHAVNSMHVPADMLPAERHTCCGSASIDSASVCPAYSYHPGLPLLSTPRHTVMPRYRVPSLKLCSLAAFRPRETKQRTRLQGIWSAT